MNNDLREILKLATSNKESSYDVIVNNRDLIMVPDGSFNIDGINYTGTDTFHKQIANHLAQDLPACEKPYQLESTRQRFLSLQSQLFCPHFLGKGLLFQYQVQLIA